VNAAVAGFLDAGADTVLINEAHATMRNLRLEEIDERAVMLTRSSTFSMQSRSPGGGWWSAPERRPPMATGPTLLRHPQRYLRPPDLVLPKRSRATATVAGTQQAGAWHPLGPDGIHKTARTPAVEPP
jgi:hypothetical protein